MIEEVIEIRLHLEPAGRIEIHHMAASIMPLSEVPGELRLQRHVGEIIFGLEIRLRKVEIAYQGHNVNRRVAGYRSCQVHIRRSCNPRIIVAVAAHPVPLIL